MTFVLSRNWQVNGEGKKFQQEAFLLPRVKARYGLGFTCRIMINLEMRTIMRVCRG